MIDGSALARWAAGQIFVLVAAALLAGVIIGSLIGLIVFVAL